MSFIDKVKYINQLAMVDEFGGRGLADKISRFYIAFRVTDKNGSEIEVMKAEVEEAILNKNILICDYMGSREFTLGVLLSNPNKCDFVMTDKFYKHNINLIGVDVHEFRDNTYICVSFRKKKVRR